MIMVLIFVIIIRGRGRCFSNYRGCHYGANPYEITPRALETGERFFQARHIQPPLLAPRANIPQLTDRA
jgi:hypothetical protein